MQKSFETKKQHFLPRFYLKQFECATPKHVRCVRLAPYLFIPAADIGGLCQESYFYGEDGRIEKLLREEEQRMAPVLDQGVRAHHFSSEELKEMSLLATMTLTRTRKAAESAKLVPLAIGNKIVQQAIESGKLPEPKGGWKEDMLDIKGISGQLIGLSYYCMAELATLRFRLLRAPEGAAFLTSDHPVVMLNQLAAGAEGSLSFVGFALAGLQLCFPISPRLCLFFFDPLVYRVWDKGKQIVDIPSEDVDLINGLQVLSAEENLYFDASITDEYVKSLVDSHAQLRRPIEESLRTTVSEDKRDETFQHRVQNLLPLKPWSFCKLLKPPRHKLGDLRDPVHTARLEAFFRDVMQRPFEYLAKLGPLV